MMPGPNGSLFIVEEPTVAQSPSKMDVGKPLSEFDKDTHGGPTPKKEPGSFTDRQ